MIENDRDVVEERVDREVAAERVLFRRAEGVVAVEQPIGLARLGLVHRDAVGGRLRVERRELLGGHLPSERGDLDRLGPEPDVGETEPAADDPAVPEQPLDLVRMRRRADVEVLRPAAEQQVADAAADEVGDVVVLVQPVQHLQRVGVDLLARDRVLRARHDDRLAHPPQL